VRAVACVGWLAVCLAVTGCSLFGKKSASNARAPAGGEPAAPANPYAAAPVPDRPAALTNVGGVLAGQVLDPYNRKPPATFIQVVSSQDAAGAKGAPIEVAADSNGYFTIQGLKPGVAYQLIARAKDGDRMLAGSTWVTPPNPTVLIRISEDLASPSTPPLPPANPVPPPSTPSPTNSIPGTARDQSWAPSRSSTQAPTAPPRRAAELGTPAPNETTPAAHVRPEDIAQGQTVRADPRVSIPSQAPQVAPREASPLPDVPARVPSCSLVGGQLYNFALHDLKGQPWEYRKNRHGRLLLLDFWGWSCPPCVEAMPHLNGLQQMYGRYGLEVIGIAYDIYGSVPDPRERVQRAERVVKARSVCYRVLMGSDYASCPVRTQFGISQFPTVVLLDEAGRNIWQGAGLDRPRLQELESRIRSNLGIR
jgi:thiol-disulfide isomerase/thioredoxin